MRLNPQVSYDIHFTVDTWSTYLLYSWDMEYILSYMNTQNPQPDDCSSYACVVTLREKTPSRFLRNGTTVMSHDFVTTLLRRDREKDDQIRNPLSFRVSCREKKGTTPPTKRPL